MLQEVLQLMSLLFLLVLFTSLIRRLINGASLEELFKTHFYEVFPIRTLMWAALCILGYFGMFFVAAVAINIKSLIFGSSPNYSISSFFIYLLINASLGYVFFLSAFHLKNYITKDFSSHSTTVLPKENLISYGISTNLIKQLGNEKFPNEISSRANRDNLIRYLLIIIASGCLLFNLLSSSYYFDQLDDGVFQDIPQFLSLYSSPLDPFFTCTALVLPCLIFMLVLGNRDYTLLTFLDSIYFKFCFLATLITCLMWMNLSFSSIWLIFSVVIFSYAFRAILDLYTGSRYRKVKSVYNPIVEDIRLNTPYLDKIINDVNLKLSPLDLSSFSQRISRGCKNIEERGMFVVKNFGRFLSLIEVQHEEFSVAMLRYLTVRRFLTRSAGLSTHRPRQHPQIEMWELTIFPIFPPEGYVNWTDPLRLPSHWDIVETCYTCGGTGTVTEHTSDGKDSSSTTKTCGTCSGSGRLEYTQILNTEWKRLLPLVTYPEIPTPELVEDAEEQIICNLPLTEHFSCCGDPSELLRNDWFLSHDFHKTGVKMKELHSKHQLAVEVLHKGHLYRSDFQIASFRTIMIKFSNLGGSRGWFFGRRPEFYFPLLPLSWETILTVSLLPSLGFCLLTLIFLISAVILPLIVI